MGFGKKPQGKVVTTKVVGKETPDTHKVTHQKVISAGPFNPMRLGMCVNNICARATAIGNNYLVDEIKFKEDVIKLYDLVTEMEIELKARDIQ